MKQVIYAFSAFIALAGAALAQQTAPTPTVQSTADDANRIIGALQEQRNNALDQAAAARAATAKVQAELATDKKELSDLKAKAATPAPTAEPSK